MSSKKQQPREREKDITRKQFHSVKSKEEGELIPKLSKVYI